MNRIKRILPMLLLAVTLLLCPTAFAEESLSLGDYSLKIEQVYINVPDMDVFLYATQPGTDEEGNPTQVSLAPKYLKAAGTELYLGDTKIDTSTIVQATDPICYMVVIDNSTSIDAKTFRAYREAVLKLMRKKNPNDQLMIFTTAGGLECMLPPTSDRKDISLTLNYLKQRDGDLDLANVAEKLAPIVQDYYQEMNPRKVLMAYTDTASAGLASVVMGSKLDDLQGAIGMPINVYLTVEDNPVIKLLEPLMQGNLQVYAPEELIDATLDMQKELGKALEIRTAVDDSMYGPKLEKMVLSVPALGSAAQLETKVYMGYRLEHPEVEQISVIDRNTIAVTFNQAVNNAGNPMNYLVRSTDIWQWWVNVWEVDLADDGRSAILTTDDLYNGTFGIALKQVTSQRSNANVSDATAKTGFTVTDWPKDNLFFVARFRVPITVAAVLVILLVLNFFRSKLRDRSAEKSAEVEHLLSGDAESGVTLPRRMVTLLITEKGSIAQNRWSGIVENSLLIGSDATQADLQIADKRVAPQHCALCLEGDALLIRPLKESNAVFVNGERIGGEHRLQNNDTLRIGRTNIQLVL